jgi:formylglycine-generating enzyme required for sulfatase activity
MPQFLLFYIRYVLIAILALISIECVSAERNTTKIIMVDIPGSNFKLSQTEITFDAYDEYVNSTNSHRPSDAGWGRKYRPVINISWKDIQDFIVWLNSTEKPDNPYRLPTEIEWELASSGGSSDTYWWGDRVLINSANCNQSCKDGFSKTSPVASFTPNQYGLYDTSGNVWEWTQTKGLLHNSSVSATRGGNKLRVAKNLYILKGGSWENDISRIETKSKAMYGENTRHYSFGFRLAQDK